jgi:4,5-dihydroxyphthalate decarboxylase
MLSLTMALGTYGLTKALKAGAIPSDRLKLELIEVAPITRGMRRMARDLEFDVCEMAFTTYLCAKAYGKPLTAIPVFVTRNFHHWAIWHNVKAGLRSPKDLEGKRVGVNRGYTVTTGLWIRGVLQDEYGVDLSKITWVPTDDEHVAEYRAPGNVDYAAARGKDCAKLLAAGEFVAAIGDIKSDSPDVGPLIPDARQAGFDYYRKTGVYPMNHGVVVKDAVLAANPWLAEELYRLFKASKDAYLMRLAGGGELGPADQSALELQRGVGGDPYPYGVAANATALATISRFAAEQGVTRQHYAPDELFAPSTLTLA